MRKDMKTGCVKVVEMANGYCVFEDKYHGDPVLDEERYVFNSFVDMCNHLAQYYNEDLVKAKVSPLVSLGQMNIDDSDRPV